MLRGLSTKYPQDISSSTTQFLSQVNGHVEVQWIQHKMQLKFGMKWTKMKKLLKPKAGAMIKKIFYLSSTARYTLSTEDLKMVKVLFTLFLKLYNLYLKCSLLTLSLTIKF